MRKLIYYVAASADGFIAREDGAVDWLSRFGAPGDYGMGAFMGSVDVVIMGRETWDFARAHAGQGPDPYAGMDTWVLSRTLQDASGAKILRAEEIPALVERLRAAKGKDIWLLGGGKSVAAFLDLELVDEIIVHIMPVLLGAGIPLIAPRRRDVPLRLLDLERYPDGVVRMRYGVGPT